ncbi:gliding-associated putative ABC transporter substrate-binding component GldG [Emticicia oligotrophica DSM 17448]|uniref:Gliding-associated putative ABC transporter substrate-binding component GldG n=1 Tax=Emticicia oligotrophica (strain DSM 17448 / CIP 109782 / MTCC 6937 / GPTSA100-15) TaxID=929562 RepID=A0ABM5N200_EMTOG|nr:gliding motility-associated ABC transporter substrate-binding protein GldG [Emticicia oligotrophica]AFK03476.1 gliding-associated putative ABC transporter substrate-binding component GldG [Emticicia oligotrophica DSM 17448]
MKNKLVVALLIIGGIVLLNIAASFFFFRLDLTEEKRYSLSNATQSLLEGLAEKDTADVFVKVYLDGDELPGGFERLKRAVSETLEEFKVYGGTKINYTFINPNSETDPKKREEFYMQLAQKGMTPTRIVDTKNGRQVETIIFPYTLVSSGKFELPVLLLKGTQGKTAEEKLNQSYENVEYELATAIRKLTQTDRKKIGLLAEFTKLKPLNFSDLIASLQERYDLFIINSKQSSTFEGLDAIILPKPDMPVDDSTKYKIDQFIMGGGRALFFVDGLKVDSVGLEGNYAQPLDLNLTDLLFKYGVRINNNIVKDGASCAVIPLVVGELGDRPNIQPVPYRYFPLINNFGKSLITNNIDLVYSRYVASMDTVRADGVTKVPLLMTSPYTKVLNAPAFITFNDARTDTDQAEYKGGVKTIAYLLEGKFQSLYKNQIIDPKATGFKAESEPTKIIVCSDGDLIVNEVSQKTGNPLPLGYDKATQHTFGNKDFVLNAIDYLIDENGVIKARGKEVKLRPLDKLRTRDERTFWQILNIGLPVGLVIVFGFVLQWLRRKNYGSV